MFKIKIQTVDNTTVLELQTSIRANARAVKALESENEGVTVTVMAEVTPRVVKFKGL